MTFSVFAFQPRHRQGREATDVVMELTGACSVAATSLTAATSDSMNVPIQVCIQGVFLKVSFGDPESPR